MNTLYAPINKTLSKIDFIISDASTQEKLDLKAIPPISTSTRVTTVTSKQAMLNIKTTSHLKRNNWNLNLTGTVGTPLWNIDQLLQGGKSKRLLEKKLIRLR